LSDTTPGHDTRVYVYEPRSV